MATPKINEAFIKKYSKLVSDTTCKMNDVNINNKTSRAILAYNLLNPDDPIQIKYFKPGDERAFYVCPNGDVVDKERNTYIMDMISACVYPEKFRNILFNNPTDIHIDKPENVYEDEIMYATNLLPLHSIPRKMLAAANYFWVNNNISRMHDWIPLIKAFTTHSYVGLNVTCTDVFGNVYEVPALDDRKCIDHPIYVSDGVIVFSSGKSMAIDMAQITDEMRYASPHYYEPEPKYQDTEYYSEEE